MHRTLINYVTASCLHFLSHDGKGKRSHINAVMAAENFMEVVQGKKENIVHQMCSVLPKRRCANRLIVVIVNFINSYIMRKAKHTTTCIGMMQVIQLDADFSFGNFLSLLQFHVDSGDNVFKEHFLECEEKCYLSLKNYSK